jgi:hypothetical protein
MASRNGPPNNVEIGAPSSFPAKSHSAMSIPLMVGICAMYVCISVVILWKCTSIVSGSFPINKLFIVSMRARAIGPVAPASPYPVTPLSVSIRIRQFPAIFLMAMAQMFVIFTRFTFAAAIAL